MNNSAIIDRSHMGRNFTGIERITDELFKKGSLDGIDIDYIESKHSRVSKLLTQMLEIPAISFKNRDSVMIFPGFPPSPFILNPDRCIMYIHDLFLIERWNELNLTARFYMNPLLRMSLARITNFFVNSETTKRNLEKYCRKGASITLYRPSVRNVFGANPIERSFWRDRNALKVIAIGTIEPRKNYLFAADLCARMAKLLNIEVNLHIVGRPGWGGDFDALKSSGHVTLHGHASDSDVKSLLDDADIYLCTSNDEGLGLPLLEVQYGGIPVIAPDKPIFREVLGPSAFLFQPADAAAAAASIVDAISSQDRLRSLGDAGAQNVARWNDLARDDRNNVIDRIKFLST